MSRLPLLSLLVFLPWFAAAALALLPRLSEAAHRRFALAASLSTLAVALALLRGFDPARTAPQFVEKHAWIGALNVNYHLGLDGLSLILVLLTGLVAPAALGASFRSGEFRGFAAFFLTLQGAALGVFLALDFFHWFIFWELSLIPAYFLIKIWGGPGATRAAYQFVIYTIGGSAFLLLGFASLFSAAGTFDLQQLAQLGADGSLARKLGGDGSWWLQAVFLGVLLGLAVKVPLWPFHTWLPPAYAEAPTGASMFLTAVMSKMGVYGFLRILWPIFPRELQAAAPWLMVLALGGVVLGAWAAMAEWARQRGDDAQARRFGDRLALAQASFEKYFWNGRYYRAAANGDQAEWVLSDALFGVLMAETAGLRGLLPADHVTAHLRRVADRNWREFGKGEFGPALLAPPEGPIPTDRLQVGEVIVGSARSTAALMQRFGLREDGGAMADAVNRTLYQRSGLQFRTPAALGAGGTFRAPSNLRPLASWYSLWPERQ